MNILLIGQTTLHWGRMEFGNIGNYYIIEPFVRELHQVFPNSRIKTTLQMSERFCKEENIELLDIDQYYSFDKSVDNLTIASEELDIAKEFFNTRHLRKVTPYIKSVIESDLVIDFSGDIWGDNADFLGRDRFKVGLYKNRIAQLLGKKTAMLAGSPGPFNNKETKEFAKLVFKNFDLVTNREPISTRLLIEEGFDTSRVKDLSCPAFLFEPNGINGRSLENEIRHTKNKPVVGFILCGWNFGEGPFDKWPREDEEFIQFVEVIEYLSEVLNTDVCLMSHSNGFKVPPEDFELIHGRDYVIAKKLHELITKRGIAQNVTLLDGIYDPWKSKKVIGEFDMLVSGRVHACVAGLSQCVPTVIIDYGHEPRAHKLNGFAEICKVEDFVANPEKPNDLINKIDSCWNNRYHIKKHLENRIPLVQKMARENFSLLTQI